MILLLLEKDDSEPAGEILHALPTGAEKILVVDDEALLLTLGAKPLRG
jgi:hypothetical protein